MALQLYRSIRAEYTMMLSPQWESRPKLYVVHSGNAAVHPTRKQHAARSARHALYRGEPNSMSTVGMLRSTLRVEIGSQWELTV